MINRAWLVSGAQEGDAGCGEREGRRMQSNEWAARDATPTERPRASNGGDGPCAGDTWECAVAGERWRCDL